MGGRRGFSTHPIGDSHTLQRCERQWKGEALTVQEEAGRVGVPVEAGTIGKSGWDPGNSPAVGSSTCEDARVATCILQDWRGGLACSACFGWEMENTRALGMRRQGQAAPATWTGSGDPSFSPFSSLNLKAPNRMVPPQEIQ